MKYSLLLTLFLLFVGIGSAFANPQPPEAPTNTTLSAQTQVSDPNATTLLESMTPSDSELSRANLELLAKNNELNRQVEDLTAQVNVLVQERSGQLFIYGAGTAIASVILGFILAKFMTRQRW